MEMLRVIKNFGLPETFCVSALKSHVRPDVRNDLVELTN